jgi:hypothetical protein
MTSQTVPSAPARRERGLGYALVGGLGITLLAAAIGGALFAWLLFATRGPNAPAMLPADTQLYAALAPNVGGVLELEQLRAAMRQNFGVTDPAALVPAIERLLGVSVRDDVVTWLGSELAVAVRNVDPALIGGADAGAALLREGEIVIVVGSKNDPQAEAFLAKHRAAREAAGETITVRTLGESTVYSAEGGAPSLVTAFGLINHYVVFSNRPAALEAMAAAPEANLSSTPGYPAFSEQLVPGRPGAVYTDGTPAAETARAALRDLLNGLAE